MPCTGPHTPAPGWSYRGGIATALLIPHKSAWKNHKSQERNPGLISPTSFCCGPRSLPSRASSWRQWIQAPCIKEEGKKSREQPSRLLRKAWKRVSSLVSWGQKSHCSDLILLPTGWGCCSQFPWLPAAFGVADRPGALLSTAPSAACVVCSLQHVRGIKPCTISCLSFP